MEKLLNNNQEYGFLLYGSTGWIGSKIYNILKNNKEKIYISKTRIENREDIRNDILKYNPNRIICAAGITGNPNVDWCEDNKEDTIKTNVIGILTLASICSEYNIHLTLIASGCIYEYDDDHIIGGKPFTENDRPNFNGSFYSKTKIIVEDLLQHYSNICILRLRMPISSSLEESKNFISKIIKYEKVINVPNSMSVLDDLLPLIVIMSKNQITGIYNFVNPGTISHNEILDLYTKYINSNYKYSNFTIEEQNKILKAKRSNNTLSTNKLENLFISINIPNIYTSIENIFKNLCINK